MWNESSVHSTTSRPVLSERKAGSAGPPTDCTPPRPDATWPVEAVDLVATETAVLPHQIVALDELRRRIAELAACAQFDDIVMTLDAGGFEEAFR